MTSVDGVEDPTGNEAQIVVALDLCTEELSGAVRLEGIDERRFVGWLGLLDALQRATSEARMPPGVSGRSERDKKVGD